MRRELNEIEYLNWCVEQPYNVVAVVTLGARLEASQLLAALDAVQRRHPLLGVNTVADQGLPSFDSQGLGGVPLRVLDQVSPEHLEALTNHELTTPFAMNEQPLATTPLARATLVQPAKTGQGSTIIFCAQHVVADGLSLLFVVKDLLRLAEKPDQPLEVLDAPASADDLFPPAVRQQVPRSSVKVRWLIPWLRLYVRLRFGRPAPLTASVTSPATHAWQLTAEQTSRLIARCKDEGVSVQTALCTAFLPSYGAINSPVNLRDRLARPVGESVGLFVGAAVVRLRYRPALGFWPNARKFHRRFRRALENPFWVFRFFSKAVPVETVREFGTLLVSLVATSRPFAITNLGSLDARGLEPNQGAYPVESFFGAVSGPVGATVLTVYTLGGVMKLHLRGAGAASQQRLASEASLAMERLNAACST